MKLIESKSLALMAVLLFPWSALAEAAQGTDAAAPMDEARSLLQKWAETERLAASERREWEQGKALLEGRMALIRQSVAEMKAKITETEQKLEDARKRKTEAEKEKVAAKEASQALLDSAAELEAGVRGLIQKAPPFIREKTKVLEERIPKEGTEIKNITAAERYQNILGILNELNKANLEIASIPEIHEVEPGRKAEVKTVYVGLGQAYFVNAAGDIGGLGRPGKEGWTWSTHPEVAPRMLEVVEVMKKTVPPKLVELPATID